VKTTEIHEIARKKGISTTGKTKTKLIREIQLSEGNSDSFGKSRDYCNQKECCFRSLCLSEVILSNRRLPFPAPKATAPRYYSTKYLLAEMFFES
jgi:hypothetical protein